MLSNLVNREFSVTAETYARDLARAANEGKLPQRAEKVVVCVAHKSSPVYAMFRDAGMGDRIDADCWCAVLYATEWGLDAFASGHIGLALAIGDSIENRVLPIATGVLS